MSLTLVSVPIGNFGDITLRAIETLKAADVIIGEEARPTQTLLKRLGQERPQSELLQLNEHSTEKELRELLEICREKKVALITDCGTPGFCDPGAALADLCLKNKIEVDVNPGASSILSLITLSGVRLDEFFFAGFLPAENTARSKRIQDLARLKTNIILMDTPYRLDKLLGELAPVFGSKQIVLGMDLTSPEQKLVRGELSQLASQKWGKAPFVLLVRA